MTDRDAARQPEWVTAIASVEDDDVIIRGTRLSELIGRRSFVDVVYLVWTGSFPTPPQARLLEALLVSVIEHGISPSTLVARQMASYGVPIQASLAAATLTFGDAHGGAGEQVAVYLRELAAGEHLDRAARRFVAEARRNRHRVEGFGHPQHSSDFRAEILLDLARREDLDGIHVSALEAVGAALAGELGRPLPVNIDGASAAILLDLGLDAQFARPLMVGPRMFGAAAHVVEEHQTGRLWRHVAGRDVAYVGPGPEEKASD